MSENKRKFEDLEIDPDYAFPPNKVIKQEFHYPSESRPPLQVIMKAFEEEIQYKYKELSEIEDRLQVAMKTLHLLRYVGVATYYNRPQLNTNVSSQDMDKNNYVYDLIGKQSRPHPAIKKLLQGSNQFTPITDKKICMKTNINLKKEFNNIPAATNSNKKPEEEKNETESRMNETSLIDEENMLHTNAIRNERFKTNYRVFIGNISKYLPNSNPNDRTTHKWMVYVRPASDDINLSKFISKVRFFLHPSYKPNDIVDVRSAPYHLARRGWGEFPLRIQIHFKNSLNKPIDYIHNLKLDQKHTGLQTLGSETAIDIWLYNKNIRDCNLDKTNYSIVKEVINLDDYKSNLNHAFQKNIKEPIVIDDDFIKTEPEESQLIDIEHNKNDENLLNIKKETDLEIDLNNIKKEIVELPMSEVVEHCENVENNIETILENGSNEKLLDSNKNDLNEVKSNEVNGLQLSDNQIFDEKLNFNSNKINLFENQMISSDVNDDGIIIKSIEDKINSVEAQINSNELNKIEMTFADDKINGTKLCSNEDKVSLIEDDLKSNETEIISNDETKMKFDDDQIGCLIGDNINVVENKVKSNEDQIVSNEVLMKNVDDQIESSNEDKILSQNKMNSNEVVSNQIDTSKVQLSSHEDVINLDSKGDDNKVEEIKTAKKQKLFSLNDLKLIESSLNLRRQAKIIEEVEPKTNVVNNEDHLEKYSEVNEKIDANESKTKSTEVKLNDKKNENLILNLSKMLSTKQIKILPQNNSSNLQRFQIKLITPKSSPEKLTTINAIPENFQKISNNTEQIIKTTNTQQMNNQLKLLVPKQLIIQTSKQTNIQNECKFIDTSNKRVTLIGNNQTSKLVKNVVQQTNNTNVGKTTNILPKIVSNVTLNSPPKLTKISNTYPIQKQGLVNIGNVPKLTKILPANQQLIIQGSTNQLILPKNSNSQQIIIQGTSPQKSSQLILPKNQKAIVVKQPILKQQIVLSKNQTRNPLILPKTQMILPKNAQMIANISTNQNLILDQSMLNQKILLPTNNKSLYQSVVTQQQLLNKTPTTILTTNNQQQKLILPKNYANNNNKTVLLKQQINNQKILIKNQTIDDTAKIIRLADKSGNSLQTKGKILIRPVSENRTFYLVKNKQINGSLQNTATSLDKNKTSNEINQTSSDSNKIEMNKSSRDQTSIDSNHTSIKAYQTPIEANQTSIEANQTSIEDNQTSIEDNQTSIEDNQTSIEVNQTSINANQTSIEVNQTSINANQTSIGANQTSIGANQTSIEAIQTSIKANQTSIKANQTSIKANQTLIESNRTSINEILNRKFDVSINQTSKDIIGSDLIENASNELLTSDEQIIDFKNYLSITKFKNVDLKSILIYLFRRIPIITPRASSKEYIKQFSFCACSETEYDTWPRPKKFCSEWYRAKLIKQILDNENVLEAKNWSVKQIFKYSQLINCSELGNREKKTQETNNDLSKFTRQFINYNSLSESKYLTDDDVGAYVEEDVVDIDIENDSFEIKNPDKTVAAKKTRIVLENDENIRLGYNFIHSHVKQLGIDLQPETITDDSVLSYPTTECVLFTSLKCFCDDVVKRALEKSRLRSNERQSVINLEDVQLALQDREEFDIFFNSGLGKNS